MRETWLAPNRRALWFGSLPPLAMVLVGLWLVLRWTSPADTWLRAVGGLLIVLGSFLSAMLVLQYFRPRIAYQDGHVLFYLRPGAPVAVPAAIVEAFFVGQGPVHVAGLDTQQETVNLVARLSQRHVEWARREVKPALGAWCDGYVIIRGTWCEPLNTEVVRRINRRLHEVKQNDHAPTTTESQPAS